MSRFYASIRGNRGEATRGGSKASGIEGHIRGWTSGVRVSCYVNEKGKDVVDIYVTKGSGCGGKAVTESRTFKKREIHSN